MNGPHAPVRWSTCVHCGRETPASRLDDGACVACETSQRRAPVVAQKEKP